MDDDHFWRDIFKEALGEFGIKNVDAVEFMNQAFSCLTTKSYQLLVLDTKEDGQTSGPNVAKRAFELGQTPVVIAASAGDRNAPLWRDLGFEYTYLDKTRISSSDIYNILKQKFG